MSIAQVLQRNNVKSWSKIIITYKHTMRYATHKKMRMSNVKWGFIYNIQYFF